MDGLFATMRRLHERGPHSRGLSVDSEGVALGPDCILVRRTNRGYERAPAGEVVDLTRSVFGHDRRLDRIPIVLTRIAEALAAGDIVKAQLLGLEIPIHDLDDQQLRCLRHVGNLTKDYDPNQPRDEQGRWTSDGSGSGVAITTHPSDVSTTMVAAGLLAPELAPQIAPFMAEAAAAIGTPAAFLGVLLIPTNKSNVVEGVLPDHPDIAYRYDEGVLSLYRTEEGKRTLIFNGLSGPDGLYRASDGQVIGRNLGAGKGFVLDPEAMTRYIPRSPEERQAEYDAQLQAYTDAVNRSEPRLCPPPSRDPGTPSKRAGLYQSQVCGLPPGWGVLFNNVRYDGCDPPTGILKECKAVSFADKMIGEPDEIWPWPDWFTKDSDGDPRGMTDIVNQMRDQSIAAGVRIVKWHVAEKPFADWLEFHAKSQGYENIRVRWTPPSAEVNALRREAMEAAGQWASESLQQ